MNRTHLRQKYLNNVGGEEQVDINWTSNDPSIITIEETSGIATAKQAGTAIITAVTRTEPVARISTSVMVTAETVEDVAFKSGSIASSSSYTLRGILP